MATPKTSLVILSEAKNLLYYTTKWILQSSAGQCWTDSFRMTSSSFDIALRSIITETDN
jgi:hypothetical protein